MTAAVRSSRSEPIAPLPLPLAVAEIGKIHFEGNIIPHLWYQHITLESGKPDLPAITILAEIVYWYRPYQTLTKGGKPILRKHFDGDRFQCTAAYFVGKFGFTKDQTRKALKRLEDAGYIHREYRDIVQQGILRNCITFVEPVPLAIMAITHTDAIPEITLLEADPPSPVGDPPSPVGDPPSPVGVVYKGIKTTTEISTETTTTTPNPSASTERAAEPKPARGGRGVQDQNLKFQDSDQEPVTLATTKQNPVSQEEIQTVVTPEKHCETTSESQNPVVSAEEVEAQRPELTYPAKLTEREREDITAQIGTLPPKTAQQMLDVIEAKRQAGQIRTNPAAVLRGIMRKHQQDSASFDPSLGFAIAEARRRRAEAEKQLQRALEARNPVPLPSPLPPRQNGPRARSAGLERFLKISREILNMPG